MMATPDVETDVLTYLAATIAADIDIAGADQNAWAGPERTTIDVPTVAVFVQVSGGSFDFHNDGALRRFDVQVMTRGARNAYEAARAKATRIHDALALVASQTINSSLYQEIRALTAAPIYLGPGDDDAEYFVENFAVWYEGS